MSTSLDIVQASKNLVFFKCQQTLLEKSVFFRNKEMMSQCNGQNTEPIVVENLVIHFDQEKFKELLCGGSPVLHAQKHRKVSVTKASVATEQKSAVTIQVNGQTSLQLLSTEAKSVSREAR